MRTLLRHALTGQYYQATGKWTSHPERAHDFRIIARAMNVARKSNCRNLEVDLTFDSAQEAAVFRLKEALSGYVPVNGFRK